MDEFMIHGKKYEGNQLLEEWTWSGESPLVSVTVSAVAWIPRPRAKLSKYHLVHHEMGDVRWLMDGVQVLCGLRLLPYSERLPGSSYVSAAQLQGSMEWRLLVMDNLCRICTREVAKMARNHRLANMWASRFVTRASFGISAVVKYPIV